MSYAEDVCDPVPPPGSPDSCPPGHIGHTFAHEDGYDCLVCVPAGWTTYEVSCLGIVWAHKNDSCCLVIHEHGPKKGISCKWGHCVPGAPYPPEWPGDGDGDGDGPDGNGNVCGPDITDKLEDLLDTVRTTFPGQYLDVDLCDRLFPFSVSHLISIIRQVIESGVSGVPQAVLDALETFWASFKAWDISQLNTYDTSIKPFYPTCAEGDDCDQTVWVGTRCFKAWAVNYSLLGVLGQQCGIPLNEVQGRVAMWKTVATVFLWPLGYRMGDVVAAQNWVRLGYLGLIPPPHGATFQGFAYVPCPKCGRVYTGALTATALPWYT
jgi:hypothetical protein